MQEAKKKALLVKIKAVGRTIKEYKSYKQEVEQFDMTLVAQDKKQAEFYKQSTSALESAKKNVVQFVGQLENFMEENKEEIEDNDDPIIDEQLQKGNDSLKEARDLLPADL